MSNHHLTVKQLSERWDLSTGTHAAGIGSKIPPPASARFSELEYKDLTDEEKDEFTAAFRFFVERFKWGTQAND